MTDITERLRRLYVQHGTDYVQEAADEIERLRAEIATVKEVEFPRKMEAVSNAWRNKLAAARDEITRLTAEIERLRDELSARKSQKPVAWISTNRISGERVLGTFRVISEYDDTLYSHTALVPKPEDV